MEESHSLFVVAMVNRTEHPNDQTDIELLNDTHRVLLATLLVVVAIVGFLTNALVIIAVALSRRLQTTTNVFVVNLATADLAIVLLLWFHVATLSNFYGLPFSESLCAAVAALTLTCIGTSVISMTMIAFNRYCLITHKPTAYIRIYTPLNIALMIALSWFYPSLMIIIGTQTGLGELGYSQKYKVCSQNTSLDSADYLTLMGGLSVLTPAVILILACYSKIYFHVRSHNRQLYRSRSFEGMSDITYTTGVTPDRKRISLSPPQLALANESTASSNSNDFDNHNGGNRLATVLSLERKRAKRVRKQQVEITKNLFLVVSAFLVCLLPATVVSLTPHGDPVVPWATAFLLFNSCINPFIYASRHPNFKSVFKSILSCQPDAIPDASWRTKRSRSRYGFQRSFRGVMV